MQDRTKLYIDGQWVDSTGTGTIDVINATTEEVIGRVAAGSAEDATKAAAAAKAALPGWSATPVEERAKFIQRLADALQAQTEEIAKTVTAEVGTPFFISQIAQAGLPGMVAGSYVQIAQEFPFEEQVGNSLDRARADRRRRVHHAVELPVAPGRREGGARARRGLHRGPEAERGRAADRVHARRDLRGDRSPEGRLQPRDRSRPRRR